MAQSIQPLPPVDVINSFPYIPSSPPSGPNSAVYKPDASNAVSIHEKSLNSYIPVHNISIKSQKIHPSSNAVDLEQQIDLSATLAMNANRAVAIPVPLDDLAKGYDPRVGLYTGAAGLNIDEDGFECPICYSNPEKENIHRGLSCLDSFCTECLRLYVQTKIDAMQVINLKCPKDDCKYILTETDIQTIVEPETFQKYQTIMKTKLMSRNPLTSYCPRPGCSRILTKSASEEFTTCECGTVVCNRCSQMRHDPKTCEQVATENAALYGQNPNLKACMVCKTSVELVAGCAHMKCPVCDYEWCWNCGREWTPGHSSRCSKKWEPKPPRALSGEKGPGILSQLWNAICLILEIILSSFFYLIGMIVIWPGAGCFFIQNTKTKSRIEAFLGFFLAYLVWPILMLVFLMRILTEEYFTCCRKRRRWRKRNANGFGLQQNTMGDNRQGQAQANAVEAGEQPVIGGVQENKDNVVINIVEDRQTGVEMKQSSMLEPVVVTNKVIIEQRIDPESGQN